MEATKMNKPFPINNLAGCTVMASSYRYRNVLNLTVAEYSEHNLFFYYESIMEEFDFSGKFIDAVQWEPEKTILTIGKKEIIIHGMRQMALVDPNGFVFRQWIENKGVQEAEEKIPKMVWKASLEGLLNATDEGIHTFHLEMPRHAKIIHIDTSQGKPCMWFEFAANYKTSIEMRQFAVIGTGWGNVDIHYQHLGTVQVDGYVWHIYETVK